jgi:arsenate reductase
LSFFPANSELIRWSFDDPAEVVGNEEEQLVVFGRVRDEILDKLKKFINSNKT